MAMPTSQTPGSRIRPGPRIVSLGAEPMTRASSWTDAVRRLLADYESSLGLDLGYQGFADEIAGLPGVYAPPSGRMLIAIDPDAPESEDPPAASQILGCVLMRPLDPASHRAIREGDCEMKRLFVPIRARGRGVGTDLVSRLLIEAAEAGYARMLLDTDPSLRAAIRIYKAAGFQYAPRYNADPHGITLYMRRTLEGLA